MPYSDDLSKEKAPTRKTLLPEGWRPFTIKSGEDKESKAGNKMFVFRIEDNETSNQEDIYIVRTEGKRWLLKQMLMAIGVVPDADGKFTYEMSDFIGKEVVGKVIHEDNEWVNREGQTIKSKQHKIVEFKGISEHLSKTKVDDISWEE